MAKRNLSLNFRKAVSVLLASTMAFSAIAPVMAEDVKTAEVQETETKVEPAQTAPAETATEAPAAQEPQESAPQEAGTEKPEAGTEAQEALEGKALPEQKATEGAPEEYMLLLPLFWDGVSYTVDDAHKSADLSDADYTVLLYKEDEDVRFTASAGDYKGMIIDAKSLDVANPLYSQKEDGSFEFKMPARDVLFYAQPDVPEEAQEPAQESSQEQDTTAAPAEPSEEQTDPVIEQVLAPSGIDDVIVGVGGWQEAGESSAETADTEEISTEAENATETAETEAVSEEADDAEESAETEGENGETMEYKGVDIPVITIEENEENDSDIPSEAEVVYPENGAVEEKYLSFWIKDTDLDFANPGFYGEDVTTTLNEGSEIPSFETLAVGDTFTLTYTASLTEEKDHTWTVVVEFMAVGSIDEANILSENAWRIIPEWIPQEGSELPIPKFAGETLTGFTYNVIKGDEAFNLATLDNGYDPQKFRIMLTDNGGFDINTPGSYQVVYDVAYFLANEYVWHVVSTVNVVEEADVNRINVISDTIRVRAVYENGTDEAVRYQDAYSTAEKSFTLTVKPTNTNILSEISPEVIVINEAGEDISGEAVSMNVDDEEKMVFSFRVVLGDGSNTITVKDNANGLTANEIKGYSGGFSDVDEEYVITIGSDEYSQYEAFLATHNLNYETGEYESTAYDENGQDISAQYAGEDEISIANSTKEAKTQKWTTGWLSISNAVNIKLKFHDHYDKDGVTDYRFSGCLCSLKDGTYNHLVAAVNSLNANTVTQEMKNELLAYLADYKTFTAKNTNYEEAKKHYKASAPVCKTSTVTVGGQTIKHEGYGWPYDNPFPISLIYKIDTWTEGKYIYCRLNIDTLGNPNHAKRGDASGNYKGRVRQTFSNTMKTTVKATRPTTHLYLKKESTFGNRFDKIDAYANKSATFTVSENGVVKGTLHTDRNGNPSDTIEVEFDHTYIISETTPPPNYKKAPDQSVTITEEDQTVPIKDEPIYGNIVLLKTSEAPDQDLSGAEYRIDFYGDAAGTRLVKSWTLRTDKDGYAYNHGAYVVGGSESNFDDDIVPFGSFRVTETKAPTNHKHDRNTFTSDLRVISKDTENPYEISYLGNNPVMADEVSWTGFEGIKVDGSVTGTNAILPGTKFDVIVNDEGSFRYDKYQIDKTVRYEKGQVIGKLVADDNGKVSTANMLDENGNPIEDNNGGQLLQGGSYLIKETTAHYGMVMPAEGWQITLVENQEALDTVLLTNPMKNTPQYGHVTVEKYDKETGNRMVGARFNVYARKDIYNVVDENGDPYPYSVKIHDADPNREHPICEIVTGDDGKGVSEDLYIGSYYAVETSSPEGYSLDLNEHDFTFTYAGQEEQFTAEVISIYDDVTTMELFKKSSADGQPIQGVTFKITKSGDIKADRAANPDAIEGGTFVTDENGKITAKYLKSGIYKVQEAYTIPGYALDTKIRYITVDKDGFIYESGASGEMLEDREAVIPSTDELEEESFPVGTEGMTDAEAYENALKRIGPNAKGTEDDYDITQPVKNEKDSHIVSLTWIDQPIIWDFSKKDVNGDDEIPGAEMEIVDEFGNTFETWTSTTETHRITGIPVGNYILIERVAPEGYAIATEIPFTVTDTAVIQHLTMLDKQHFIHKSDITGEPEIPGATLYVTDKETGEEVDRFVSGDKPHPLSNIVVGRTYILHEEVPAEGYCIASDVEFKVDDNFKTDMTTMKDKQVLVYKEDVAGKEIPGASLTVTDKDTNEVVDSWISTEKPHPVNNLRVGKTYILKEVLASEGYVLANDVEFFVPDDFNIQHVEMVDKQVFITKTDLTNGDELPGAKLVVKDENGNVVDKWISTKQPHPVNNLKVGYTYVLTEKKPADGYTTAESITFTVNDDFKVDHYKMEDDVTKVRISKVDMANGNELPGAQLIIKDKSGKTVESWTSTTEPHMIYKLPIGTYTLTEVTAPNGYAVAESIQFKVTDSNIVHDVTMKDAPLEVNKPKTGDEFPVWPTACGIGITLLLVALYFVLRGRKKSI